MKKEEKKESLSLNRKIFAFLLVFISLFAVVVAVEYLDSRDVGKIKIVNYAEKWKVIHTTLSDSKDFFLWYQNITKKDSEICFLSYTAKKEKDLVDLDFYVDINKDGKQKQKLESLKATEIKSDKSGLTKDYFGYCYTMLNDEKYIKFGSNSPALVYENETQIIYEDKYINISVELSKWNGVEYVNSPEEVFIDDSNQEKLKYGAIDNSLNDGELGNYKYTLSSSAELFEKAGEYYFKKQGNEYIHSDFSDICSRDFNGTSANCSISYYSQDSINYLEVQFISDKNIDPSFSTYTSGVSNNFVGTGISEVDNIVTLEINSSNSPYDKIIAYYPFDADNSTTSYDMANSYDATYSGSYSEGTSCLYDNCAYFDGSNDFISIPYGNGFNLSANNISISLWAKQNVSSQTGTYIATTPGTNQRFSFGATSNKYHMGLGSVAFGGGSAVTTPTTGWTHLVMSLNGTHANLYVNGTFSYAQSYTPFVLAGNFYEGYFPTVGYYLNGSLDEIMIFNKSLTQQEITDIYNNQSNRFVNTSLATSKQITLNETIISAIVNASSPEKNLSSNLTAKLGYWNVSYAYNVTKPITNGLVAYYTADGNANDYLGLKNGTLTSGALANGSGVYNNSFILDGVDDTINVTTFNLNLSSNPYHSFSVWIKPRNASQGTEYANQFLSLTQTGQTFFGLNVKNNQVKFLLRNIDNTYIVNNLVVATGIGNSWQHFSLVLNNGTAYVYINGVLNSTTSYNSSIPFYADILNIGSKAPFYYFNGSIDDVMIFNRSLNSSEIKELYIKGLANWQYTDTYNLNTEIAMSSLSATNLLPVFNLTASPYNFYTPFLKYIVNVKTLNYDVTLPSAILTNPLSILVNGLIPDKSGNARDGTTVGGVTLANGTVGNNSLSFDGSTGYVNVSSLGNNYNYSNNMSVCLWLKTSETASSPRIISTRSGASDGFQIRHTAGILEAVTDTGSAVVSTGSLLSVNTWTFSCLIYNGTNALFYQNNTLKDNDAITGYLDDTFNLKIGASETTPNYFFNGSIDEVRIYNRSLNSTEMDTLFSKGNVSNGLLAYYDMEGLISDNPNQNFTVSLTDNLGIANSTIYLYNSTGLLNSTTTVNVLTTIASQVVNLFTTITDGVYTWFAKVFDWAGNSYTTTNSTITIFADRISPNISFVNMTPSDGAIINQTSIAVNVSSYDVNDHYVVTDFDNSLSGLYRFEQGNGTFFANELGKINGTCTGTACPSYTNLGYFGGGYEFDGSNDLVTLANAKVYGYSEPFTLSVWAKPKASANTGMIGFLNTGYAIWWRGWYGFSLMNSSGGTTYEYNTSLGKINQWSHLTLTNNGSGFYSFYINGVLERNVSYLNITSNTQTFNIGAGSFGGQSAGRFNGTMDEIMLFNRSLSPTEILSMYNASANKYYKNFTDLSDGNHTIKSYAVDKYGNLNSTELRTVNIVLDNIAPNISFVSPTTSSGTIDQDWIFANVTAYDTALKNVTLNLYNSTGLINSTTSTGNLSLNFTNLTEGTYYLNATAFDNYLNNNKTETRTIILDRTAPVITIDFPTATNNPQIVSFQIRTNEVSSCLFDIDTEPIEVLSTTDNLTHSTTKQLSGTHSVIFYCNDSLNHQSNASITFEIGVGTSTGGGGGGGGTTPIVIPDQNLTNVTVIIPTNATFWEDITNQTQGFLEAVIPNYVEEEMPYWAWLLIIIAIVVLLCSIILWAILRSKR